MNAGRRLVGGWSEVDRAPVGRRSEVGRSGAGRSVGRRSEVGRRSIGGRSEVGRRSVGRTHSRYVPSVSRAPASELVLQRGGLPSEITLPGGASSQ